jgi:acylphosphatase
MTDARAYHIIGRVQGVGFRWWVRTEAVGLGLSGWVRNEPDGSVAVEAGGSHHALERFERALQRGPPGAEVERVRRGEPGPGSLPQPFVIRR